MIRRLALALLVCFLAAPAFASEWHVNNAVACADSNAGTTSAPLCTILGAYGRAVAGDTITVHAGTYVTNQTISITKDNLTFRAAPGETVTVDFNRTAAFGFDSQANRTTIDGFRIVNLLLTCEGQCSGPASPTCCKNGAAVQALQQSYTVAGMKKGAVFKNLTIEMTDPRHAPCASCFRCIEISGQGDFLVENNTCTGAWSQCVVIEHQGAVYLNAPAGWDPPDMGGTVRNNTCRATGSDDWPQRALIAEGVGFAERLNSALLIYNNKMFDTGTRGSYSFFLFHRESAIPTYVFNNYAYKVGNGVYMQEDFAGGSCNLTTKPCPTERFYFFNNTLIGNNGGGGAGGYNEGLHWPGCYTLYANNNIFSGFNYAIAYYGSGSCTGRGPLDSTRGGSVNNNLFKSRVCNFQMNNQPTGNGCIDPLTTPPPFPDLAPYSANLLNQTPLLDANGKLLAGSPGLDVASPNPIFRGANVCSVTENSRLASCLLDIDGDNRPQGNGWDIGYDERIAGAPTGGAPPPPGDLRRTDTP